MKNRISFLVLFVIVLLVFSSCHRTPLPTSSPTFSKSFVKSFFNDYQLVDLQLAYRTASSCEVEITSVPANPYSNKRFESVLLSQIKNVSSLDFVAVTELSSTGLIGGGPISSTWVYKNKKAPNPMADWNISMMDVLAYSDTLYEYRRGDYDYDNSVEELGKTHITSATVICSFTPSDVGFFETVKESYARAKKDSEWDAQTSGFKKVLKSIYHYSLLVCFEESEELVWESQLYICDEVLYFACYSYDGQNSQHKTKRYARLDDELSQIILDCLELETDDSGGSSQPVESEPSASQ